MRFTILIFTFCITAIHAQTTSDFESFNLEIDTFLNGMDGSAGFSEGNIFLPNDYNTNFMSWSGWAISTSTDVTTPGFTNQYSSIAGNGFDNSQTYATTFVLGESQIKLTGDALGGEVNGVYVSNATYSYLSIRDGDGFAKKFGGETGDDPDFFLLTIKKYLNGQLGQDSINFYLADYRFSDNTQDYIIDAWSYIDLLPLGNVDSLSFSLSSTDNGAFGMNTPAYFCIDNFETADAINTSTKNTFAQSVKIYPNPTSDFLNFNLDITNEHQVRIYQSDGQLVLNKTLSLTKNRLDIAHLENARYFGIIEYKNIIQTFDFVKL